MPFVLPQWEAVSLSLCLWRQQTKQFKENKLGARADCGFQGHPCRDRYLDPLGIWLQGSLCWTAGNLGG